jgi:Carboxypeptidase regulatory-like domain
MFRAARFGLTVLLLSIVVLAVPALAEIYASRAEESGPRTLTGTVLDQDNRAVSGAVVYLKNQRNLAILTYITGGDGNYRFNNLSPDADYQVRAEFNGHKSEGKSLSSFDSRKQAHIDLKLGK